MKRLLKHTGFTLFILVTSAVYANDFKVGIGRKIVTPKAPAWLTGYAVRDKPADGVIHDLWAKAVAIKGNGKELVVIVSTDLLGLSHEVSEDVAREINEKYGIPRSALMFNSSHTHSGPMVWPALSVIADYDMANQQVVSTYGHQLTGDLIEVIEMSLKDMKPMKIFSGFGSADFAKNRRQKTDNGIINGVNPSGAVDHDVPVIKIETDDGTVQAILFAYACHNTTVTSNNYSINGDYAGFAQIELEKAFQGATAMFIMGCGGDQNPYPRGSLDIARQHGSTLAVEIKKILNGTLKRLQPNIRTAFTTVKLTFKPAAIKTFQKDMVGDNVFLQRRAMLMLQAYNKGWDAGSYPYPVQAIRLSNDLVILALAGEVVVDYALRVKKKYDREKVIVAGYSNEVMCYIPTRKMLEEGGYEADQSMIYYGMQGPFEVNVEERIMSAIDGVIKKASRRSRGTDKMK
jgi:hypothetical protein